MIDFLLFIISVFFLFWAITGPSKLNNESLETKSQLILFNAIIIVFIAIAIGSLILLVA